LENVAAFPVPALRQLPRALRLLPASMRDRATRAELLRIGRAERAELIHAHFGYALPYATVFANRRRIPVVVSLHGHDATAWPSVAPWAYANAPRVVDAVIVPSEFLARRARELGFEPASIHIVPSGVDTAVFPPIPLARTAPPVVGFVGRLVAKKGIDVLLAAWPIVQERVPQARLRVLGDGPLRHLVTGHLVEWIAPDANRRVQQVRDVLASARVVVTPSTTAPDGDSESQLIVNLEAQASGRPLVTTRHGGIPEFVDEGSSALVVTEGDAAALASALIRVLRDDDLAQSLAAAGPAVASRFGADAMARRLDAVYDEVLRTRDE
jgi:glycosyltransferase involved in cell wall biosynthesis